MAKLTFGKGTTNTAVRWLPFFLPTLALAFDSSTATLALVLGLAEASGLSTVLVGRRLDAGRERLVIIAALCGVAVASTLALVGSIWTFAVAAVVLGASAGHVTVAGHAWISARVPFDRRARFIGIYEISWASALLIGVPIIALLISGFGWRGPFVAVAGLALVAAGLIGTINDGAMAEQQQPAHQPPTAQPPSAPPSPKASQSAPGSTVRPSAAAGPRATPLTIDAWLIIAASAAVAMAGLTTIVVAGTWLDEAFGISTGGVGLVAMTFGAAELLASTSSSAFADRLGKRRTMQATVLATLVGLAVIFAAGSALAVGIVGLLIFFVGFEYSIVTSFSLISEAMPDARGRVLGIGNGANTLSRGIGVSSAGVLYERFGIAGPATLSAAAAGVTLVLLTAVARRRPDLH